MTRWLIFMIVIIPLWGVLHWYVGRRLLTDARTPRPVALVAWTALIAHACLSPLTMIARQLKIDATWQEPLIWLTYLGMGAFAWTATLVLARDLPYGLYLLGRRLRRRLRRLEPGRADAGRPDAGQERAGAGQEGAQEPSLGEAKAQGGPQVSRRQLLTSVTSAGIAAAGVSGSVMGYHQATRIPEVLRVRVPIRGLPEALRGLRVVQISDIHIGNTISGEFLAQVVQRVNALEADLVAITGDLVDGYVDKLFDQVAIIDQLEAKLGVFYVPGNHEYYWDGPAWIRAIDGLPRVRALVNAHEVVELRGHKVVVGGVTDYSAARMVPEHASDPHKAIAAAPADAALRLLLAHQPKSVYEASRAGFDLQLSGHTHGGQFYPWNFVVGMVHPFSRGLGDYEQMKIYVSCGTGYWGPPMRLGAPSEITLLELEPA